MFPPPPPRHSPCFSFSRGLAARLRGVRRAMPALREQGTDPQPSRGSCAAGLAGCCHTAAGLSHRQAANRQSLEGPCEFSSLGGWGGVGGGGGAGGKRKSSFLRCFSIFHHCEGEPQAFPTQPEQAPVGAYTSIPPTQGQSLPRTSLPSVRRQGACLAQWLVMFEFQDGK